MGYNSQESLQKQNIYHGYTYVRGTPNCPLKFLFVHLFCWGCPPIGMYMHSDLSGLLFFRTEKEYLRKISGIQLEFLILYIYVNIIHTYFFYIHIYIIYHYIYQYEYPTRTSGLLYLLIDLNLQTKTASPEKKRTLHDQKVSFQFSRGPMISKLLGKDEGIIARERPKVWPTKDREWIGPWRCPRSGRKSDAIMVKSHHDL